MGQVELGENDRATDQAKDGVQLARDRANLCVRIFNTQVTLTDGEGPGLRESREVLLGKLEESLKEKPKFFLEIKPFEILCQGESVYEDHDPGGLPETLHRGGLKGLGFDPGITRSELASFFDVLKNVGDPRGGAEDLFSVLQDEDFPHLDCVPSDDYLEFHPLPVPGSLEDLKRQYPRGAIPRVRKEKILRECDLDSENDLLEPLPEGHRSLAHAIKNINRLGLTTPQDMEVIQRQILHESALTFDCYGLEILVEVLLLEQSREDFNEITAFLLKILDSSLRAGDYQAATEVIKRLYTVFRMGGLNGWQRKRIKKAIFDAGTASRIGSIGERIKASDAPDFEALGKFALLLQKNAVPHLCNLLGELKGSKPRRIICDVLVSLGKDSTEVFGAFLDDNRWYMVRNMVYILGRIGKAECLPYLEKALDHPDPRVRREAVQAISMSASREKAVRHLKRKLNDMDSKIRGFAALRLARIGGEQALRPLLDLLLSRAFYKREIHEIKLFLQAIGTLGSDGAVPALFRILLKKSFFGKIRTDEIRKCAAHALAAIGTQEAVTALRKVSVMGDDFAKETSLAVLNRIGKL